MLRALPIFFFHCKKVSSACFQTLEGRSIRADNLSLLLKDFSPECFAPTILIALVVTISATKRLKKLPLPWDLTLIKSLNRFLWD